MRASAIWRAAPSWSSSASPARTTARAGARSWKSASRLSPEADLGVALVASVELRGLSKRYGAHTAVDDVSLTIEHGKVVCLLGPSGCGKTTTLRLIAGFLEPSAGEIRGGPRIVASPGRRVPPQRRNMSMIFQSYALWPHMTVAENVAYGLKLRKRPRVEIAAKVAGILATTKLASLGPRYPHELSGGQQQRVALARALVVEPETLLLD